MFGTLRFLLAYLVILSHLVGSDYVVHFGFYAVRGFFVISGLLMTAALNEAYGFDGLRFWVNRALRLLPPYYLVCALFRCNYPMVQSGWCRHSGRSRSRSTCTSCCTFSCPGK